MGHVITSDGLQADPNKIKAILNMPIPTDKEAVQRLLGMFKDLPQDWLMLPNH